MKVETLKELEALVKMCRKHGVRSIEVDGIKMLIEEPDLPKSSEAASDPKTEQPLTDEQLLFWSSGIEV
jgi:hypothetical protein